MKVLLDIEPVAGLVLVSLKSAGGNKVPTEFRIFPYGTLETDKGQFKFDEGGADLILADRARRKARVQIDYDHLAIKSEKPGDGKAFGWCDLEKRADGLYAVNITWTPAGQKALEDGEYASFSPFFGATKKDHRIVMLFNIAATNLPAMHDAEMLVAAARRFIGSEEVEEHACVIKKEGDKFVLYSHEGKKLGEHPSRAAAEKQESAVNISKAREAGHHIPHATKDGHTMAHKLGGYMAARMKKDGMSLKALSEKSGLTEDRCRALHDGEAPNAEEMKALAKGFGMKDDEFQETVDASSFDNSEPDEDDTEDEKDDKKAVAAARKLIKEHEAKQAKRGKNRRETEVTPDDTDLDLVELTQTTDKKQQREVLKGIVAMAKEFVPLKKQFDENQKVMVEQKREALIQKGKAECKLTPSLIRYWASRSVEEFEEALKAMPVLSTANLNLREGEASAAAAILSHEEIEVCRLSNSSVDELAAFVKGEKTGENERAILASYYAPAK